MFSHTLFAVSSFTLFLLPFTSQYYLKFQIIGWRHLEAYSHLLSLAPDNRFEIRLSKNGQNAKEPPMVCRIGHYDVTTMPLPNAWLNGLQSQKTSDFVGGSEMVLSIFTPSDGKHHGVIYFIFNPFFLGILPLFSSSLPLRPPTSISLHDAILFASHSQETGILRLRKYCQNNN
jgi:hypothetical protein